jgi:hypothetical protein
MILCNREDNMTNGLKNDRINFPALSVLGNEKAHSQAHLSNAQRDNTYKGTLLSLAAASFVIHQQAIRHKICPIYKYVVRAASEAAAARAATDGKRSYISMARGGDLRLRQSHFAFFKTLPSLLLLYVHAII